VATADEHPGEHSQASQKRYSCTLGSRWTWVRQQPGQTVLRFNGPLQPRALADTNVANHSTGELVRNLRAIVGLSQSQLAVKSGVTERTISRMENGSLPRPESLRRIALALGRAVAQAVVRS
jgi:DNA-binding XRE family transcriptional regulator